MAELQTKICKTCKQSFVLATEDIAMYGQADIPVTEECVYCQWQRLLAFWILGRFRITKSALSGKQLITVLPETAPFPIYAHDEFISDAWDPLTYGRDYDSTRPFIDQLVELQSKVPHPHQIGLRNTNCDWTDDWWDGKDSYLCRSGLSNEFMSYAYRTIRCKESVDITYSFDMQQSYDCLYCFKGYRLKYSFNCHDCIDSAFLYDCRNCTNCFMSWNLRNKQYCILNQQYTKEEYEAKLKQYSLRSYAAVQQLKQQFNRRIAQDAVHRANYNVQVANSTGNFLSEDKNCANCAFFEKSENCRQLLRGYETKDSIEAICCAVTQKSSRTSLDQFGYGNTCVLNTSNCRYSYYSDACEESEYLFGCVGLRKKNHCVLNKQYTKEEYEKLIEKIKADMKARGEWGRFVPFAMAYAGYNTSLGQLLFPLTKEQAVQRGMKWDEAPTPSYQGAIQSDELPDSIDSVTEDVTKQRIVCAESKLSYNIAPVELAFYKQHGIPLPQRHFDWRTFNRFRPMALMVRPQKGTCFYCKKEIEHYYDPQLGYQKIACIECYQQNIS